MDLSGRTAGSGSSNGSGFIPSNSIRLNPQQQQQQQHRYQGGSAPFVQPLQGSPSASDQQRIFQMKIQEMQLMQLRQNHMQQQRLQHQLSPGSSQLQHIQNQNEEQLRRNAQISPNALHMSPGSFASPSFARQFIGSPSSNSLAGFGSISSIKSVISQFQQQKPAPQGPQLPPAPPLVSVPQTTMKQSSSVFVTTAGSGGEKVAVSAAQADSQTNTQSTSTSRRHPSISAPPLAPEEASELLKKCDWVDKTLWVSRQLLGGQSVNGFLRSTATVQRIKKQRARQTHKTKHNSEDTNKKRGPESSDQGSEETLKKEVMNVRTAKKIKSELEIGVNFCRMLHGTILTILHELDPSLPPVEPLAAENHKSKSGISNNTGRSTHNQLSGRTNLPSSQNATIRDPPSLKVTSRDSSLSNNNDLAEAMNMKQSVSDNQPPVSPLKRQDSSNAASAGNPSGSTLRKNRKKKLPPNTEPPVNLPEFDSAGKRIFTKKEHMNRLFECIRYRALRQGDFVAARVSSRDLWILARVMKDYAASNLSPLEFSRLPESKREQLFKEKVLIKDVEDKQRESDAGTKVARSLVLPLPRSFAEAADWGQHYKKGSRVYAMYPHTTALYKATVMDATTYARDDDDIIVVRFDGDEPDSSGAIPECHIPSRFVTLIPRGLLGAQSSAANSAGSSVSGTTKKKWGNGNEALTIGSSASNTLPPQTTPVDHSLSMDGNFDDLNLDDPLPGLDGFDDLEFDLLGD